MKRSFGLEMSNEDADRDRPQKNASPTAEITPVAATEETPLLPNTTGADTDGQVPEHSANGPSDPPSRPIREVLTILSVLLIGVFISQTDATLVFATLGDIASEFNDLQSSAWLISSFGLASCVAQPLYGKLSDIFGRKTMLQVAYLLFALGGAACGLGRSMPEVIVGRSIQGTGSAGMVALVSILITDLVPLRDIATYRSYVNVVQTAGRSAGGPIGGFLAQSIGWRWAFLGQAPATVVAMVAVAWKLQIKPGKKEGDDGADGPTILSKLKRIDVVGALFLSATILAGLLVLDMGGDKVPWNSPLIYVLAGTAVVCAGIFYVVEEYWATEPIFPTRLITHKEVLLDYAIQVVQTACQVALMYFIPLYFQVTKGVSAAEAGAYMVPAVIGNTIGGLSTGYYVKATGRYKLPLIGSGLSAMLCFSLLLATWHGDTPVWQAVFVIFGGFASGVANSATFVDVAATVDASEMAIASSGLYLGANIGMLVGVSAAGAIFTNTLKHKLGEVLAGFPNGEEVNQSRSDNFDNVS